MEAPRTNASVRWCLSRDSPEKIAGSWRANASSQKVLWFSTDAKSPMSLSNLDSNDKWVLTVYSFPTARHLFRFRALVAITLFC